MGFSPLIIERLSFGLDGEEASLDAGNAEMDEAELNRISAGRIDKIWLPLLPEVARNPLFGNGRYTTLKSEAFANKTWGELGINSPHSAYIEVLIDMGLSRLRAGRSDVLAHVPSWWSARSTTPVHDSGIGTAIVDRALVLPVYRKLHHLDYLRQHGRACRGGREELHAATDTQTLR